MSGRPFFSCAVPASGDQPVPVRSVHGSYACEKCHRGGSCAELYGTWSSGGSGFLGQYALTGGAGALFPRLVDDSDSRHVSDGNAAVPDKSGRVYAGERE